MKRLVLLVEGAGDVLAAPVLVNRILTEQNAWDVLFADRNPMRIGGLPALSRDDFASWKRYLAVAAKRKNIGACLTILDGDTKAFQGASFCAASAARAMSDHAQEVGAGVVFSVATVFACIEYESWLIAAVESLAGKLLSGDRAGVLANTSPPTDTRATPRDGCQNGVTPGTARRGTRPI